MIFGAAGFAEGGDLLTWSAVGAFALLLFTFTLVGVLGWIVLQTMAELLVARPKWNLKMLMAFTLGAALAASLCVLIYS